MKKYLVALAVVLIGTITISYGQQGDRTAAAKRMTDSMTVKLQLSPDQAAKVQAINETFAGKAGTIRKGTGDRMEKMKQMKEAGHERDNALKGVLTDTQYKEYLAHRKEMKHEARGRMRDKKRS